MRKKLITGLLATVMAVTAAFAGTAEVALAESASASQEAAASEEVPETTHIRWNYGGSGNILVILAQKLGYLEEYGLEVELIPAAANSDALTMLASNQVDVVSNAGTSNPLQQISSGMDYTIFGGHMVNGCMPVIAKKGTQWNGIEDFIGKKVAVNPSYFAFTGAIMDLGYDDPLEAVEWVSYSNYSDAMAAVIKGEVDYALQGTNQTYACLNNPDIEIVSYQSDIMPNYSCCRLVAQTSFVEENPVTIKLILKALLRAQAYYEANSEEAVQVMADTIEADYDYVAAYMLNDHYLVHVDPLRNSVVRAWDILDKTGFLSEDAKKIDINDYINTEIYEQAVKEVTEEYGSEDQDFYDSLQNFYEENDL